MKLLVINPNISHSVTALIAAEAQRAVGPWTEIVPVTAPFGVAYIEAVSEATIGAYAAMTLYAEHGARSGTANARQSTTCAEISRASGP